MITWPAILKYEGEDELIFIASQKQWKKDPDLFYYAYEPDDVLIDSEGNVYSLDNIEDHFVTPVLTDRAVSLEEVADMLKAHMSVLEQCCISKLSVESFAEAIVMVGEIEEMD